MKTILNKWIMILVLSLSSQAFADEIDKNLEQEIHKFFKSTRPFQQVEQSFDLMQQSMINQNPKLFGASSEIIPIIKSETMIIVKKLYPALVKIYAAHFTYSDMKALNLFYTSPTGQKFLQSQASLQQEYLKIFMPLQEESSLRMQAKIKSIIERAPAEEITE